MWYASYITAALHIALKIADYPAVKNPEGWKLLSQFGKVAATVQVLQILHYMTSSTVSVKILNAAPLETVLKKKGDILFFSDCQPISKKAKTNIELILLATLMYSDTRSQQYCVKMQRLQRFVEIQYIVNMDSGT